MATTVLQIIESALRVGGMMSEGETLTAQQAQDGRQALNFMLESQPWQGLALVGITHEYFSLVAGQASYTMGIAGNFNTVCPTKIVGQYTKDGDGNDYPLAVVGNDYYDDIVDKTTGGRPEVIYVSYGYPLTTIYFYFVPDTTYTFYVDSEKPLADLTTLTQNLTLAPGYLAALKWNLAIELLPEYGKEPSSFQFRQAERYLKAIKNINAANRVQAVTLNTPFKPKVRFNIKNLDYDVS